MMMMSSSGSGSSNSLLSQLKRSVVLLMALVTVFWMHAVFSRYNGYYYNYDDASLGVAWQQQKPQQLRSWQSKTTTTFWKADALTGSIITRDYEQDDDEEKETTASPDLAMLLPSDQVSSNGDNDEDNDDFDVTEGMEVGDWPETNQGNDEPSQQQQQQLQATQDLNHFDDSVRYPSSPLPRIAWIMSIGGSGTSYTIANLEAVTRTTTATNYVEFNGVCQPTTTTTTTTNHTLATATTGTTTTTMGPCWHRPDQYGWPRKPFWTMTKTHCTAYCMQCSPSQYILKSAEEFAQGCRSGVLRRQRLANDNNNNNNATTIVSYTYPNMPARVVHLIRDPFDNLVGRWHLSAKKRVKQQQQQQQPEEDDDDDEDNDEMDTIPAHLASFTEWCRYLNEKTDAELAAAAGGENMLLFLSPPGFWQRYQHVPCYAEWFRYIQWHNLAFAMTTTAQQQVHYLYYENYTLHYDQTVQDLLQFLEWNNNNNDDDDDDENDDTNTASGTVTTKNLLQHQYVPFYAGKSYREMFDSETEIPWAARMVQELAFPPVWDRLEHYFQNTTASLNVPFVVDRQWRKLQWPLVAHVLEEEN